MKYSTVCGERDREREEGRVVMMPLRPRALKCSEVVFRGGIWGGEGGYDRRPGRSSKQGQGRLSAATLPWRQLLPPVL